MSAAAEVVKSVFKGPKEPDIPSPTPRADVAAEQADEMRKRRRQFSGGIPNVLTKIADDAFNPSVLRRTLGGA